MKKAAGKKTKKAAPSKARRSAARGRALREPEPKASGSLASSFRSARAKRGAKTKEDKRYVVVRTPYPTLEETAATLGVPLTRANRIRDLVREELVLRDARTGTITITAPKVNGALMAMLTSRRGR